MVSASDPLLRELRATYGRVAYSHKTHEKERELKAASAARLRVWNVIIFGVATAAAVAAPLVESVVATWVAAGSTLVGLVFVAVQLSFTPAEDAASHALAAKSYLAVRNEYSRFIADVSQLPAVTAPVRARRDHLAEQLRILEDLAPSTSQRAYVAAQDALRKREELTFTDSELDALLPPSPSASPDEAK